MKRIRVLIVDDSPTMRAILRSELESDPQIQVVGAAQNAIAAREAIKALLPEVLTLDLNMPEMHGLEFLEKLMRLRPIPVVVVSSEVSGQSDSAVHALALGAFDCFLKPTDGTRVGTFDKLRDLVRGAAKMRIAARKPPKQSNSEMPSFAPNGRIVAIGASTGGVEALLTVLSRFPSNCPPTLVTQHMPGSFTASFAKRLDQKCAAKVIEAKDGIPLEAGTIYLAPGSIAHLEVFRRERPIFRLRQGSAISGHMPSVDALFESIARLGIPAVGVILTGMGDDGARGLLAMRQVGCRTLGQDERTSIVYGMPRAAYEIGAVEEQLPLSTMAQGILDRCDSAITTAET